MIARGGQLGAIAKDGKTLFELYDLYCLRHPKPQQMKQALNQFIEKKDGKESRITIYNKTCLRCGQNVVEGELKDE